jgi:hypothetical protein
MKSLFRVIVFILALGFGESVFGIGSPGAAAQAIRQLRIQDIGNVESKLANVTDSFKGDSYRSTALAKGILDFGEGVANPGQFSANDPDYLSRIERNDWCAAYALYRYTLEVNGIEMLPLPDWERVLRCYCSEQTKLGEVGQLMWEGGGQRKTDHGNIGTYGSIILIPQLQTPQCTLINFQNSEVSSACKLVDWRDHFSWNTIRNSIESDREPPVLLKSPSIRDYVQGGNNPPIWIDNKATSMHIVGIDLNDSFRELATGFNASDWTRILSVKCGSGDSEH